MWHDSDRRLAKALERFEEGDLDTARTMLKSLDRQGVISPRIDLYLGHCHLESDQHRAALRRYRRAAALGKDKAAPWIGLGLCYGRLGDLSRAIDAFLEAVRREPEVEEAHCNLVHCYALIQDIDKAEEHARIAVDLDPACPHTFRHLAMAYLIAGQQRQAMNAWRQVERRLPEHPELPLGLGRTYAAQEELQAAREQYLKALDGPFRADAHYGLGDLAREAGRLGEAAEHYGEATAEDPTFREARLRHADTLLELGRLDEAEEALTGVPEVWPPDPEAVAIQARIHLARGARRRALGVVRRLLGSLALETDGSASNRSAGDGASDLHAANALRAAGEVLLDAGRPRVAVRLLRRALRRQPEDSRNARLLARALGRAGRLRRAVSVLARAAWRAPREREIHLDVAAAQLARGRLVSAERHLLRALSWNPDDAGLWAAAAEMALEQGRSTLARSRIRSALKRHRRHPHALALMLRWCQEAGQFKRAAAVGEAAVQLAPEGDEVVRRHGEVLLALGRPAEALLPLRRHALAVPDDPAGYEALAEAYEALGDEARALDQRRLAQLVRPD